jgi:hypothetical protein
VKLLEGTVLPPAFQRPVSVSRSLETTVTMKFLTLVSSLAAVAYATPAEAEAQDALIPQSNVNGEKILPRFSQSS